MKLEKIKTSLANKYFTAEVKAKAISLSQDEQQRLLDVMINGLSNNDSIFGVYATRP